MHKCCVLTKQNYWKNIFKTWIQLADKFEQIWKQKPNEKKASAVMKQINV